MRRCNMNKKSWGIFEEGKDVHLMPIDDTKPHYSTPNCDCEPDGDIVWGGVIWKHHAYDGRELFEEIDEILKMDE
jgi:hypothetical protein